MSAHRREAVARGAVSVGAAEGAAKPVYHLIADFAFKTLGWVPDDETVIRLDLAIALGPVEVVASFAGLANSFVRTDVAENIFAEIGR